MKKCPNCRKKIVKNKNEYRCKCGYVWSNKEHAEIIIFKLKSQHLNT